MDFGEKIKQLRKVLNLTQEELANRCELTKSYISQLENNKTSPSLQTLTDILEVLGTNLADFFNEDEKQKLVFNEDEQVKTNFSGYEITWLIPTSQKLMMESILVEIEPFSETLEDRPHDGQEFGYVLEGKIEVVCGNSKEICNAGEAFYFETSKFHYLINKTDQKAKVIWVSSPPNF